MDRRPPPDTTVVTGAAGWLGRALLHELGLPAGRHHRPGTIVAVVRDPAEARASEGVAPQVRAVVADVTDPEQVRRAMSDLDGTVDVIHTAGVIHPRNVRQFHEVNAGGTRHVIAAARERGVRRLVHVSSNSPFGTNPSHADTFGAHEPYHPYLGYGTSKMEAELAVFDAVRDGLDAVVVRPPWFYGPWQPPRQTTFFRMVRSGRFPVMGDGGQRRSMVYVGNLVDGIVAAELTEGVSGRGYWVADERPYTVAEIVTTVRAALEAEGLECADRTLHVPVLVGRIAERGDRALQRLGRYQQQLHVLGEMAHSIAVDISATRADLGYEPAVDLATGMRTSIRWCLDEGYQL